VISYGRVYRRVVYRFPGALTACLRNLARVFLPTPTSVPPGPWGERVAARFITRQGLRILERYFRVPAGEIDVVALDGQTVVFVEVKTSAVSSRARGLDRIGREKRRRIRRAAMIFLRRRRPGAVSWRVDAVVVEYRLDPRGRRRVESIDWYPALFPID